MELTFVVLKIDYLFTLIPKPHAKDFSKLIDNINDREDRHMIETVMLRSLSQAQYSPKNIGHFGLAYPVYTHFTSPIRRYPDLLVHRTIVNIINEFRKIFGMRLFFST